MIGVRPARSPVPHDAHPRAWSHPLVANLAIVPTLVLALAAATLSSTASAQTDKPATNAAAGAKEPAKTTGKSEEPKSADVTVPPPASDFLIVPLRIHVLKSDVLEDVDCALTDDDVRRVLGKANKVWSVAGIHFGLESIRRETAEGQEKFKLAKDLQGSVPLNAFRSLIPEASRKFDGQHVYYIHKFSVNGVYLGNKISFVQETAKLRPVPGGIDEPLPRVTAHELGHALGLPHRQDRTNLLASGTTGTLINEAEVKRVRSVAQTLAGTRRYSDLEAESKRLKESGRAEAAQRLDEWRGSVDAVAREK